MKKIIIGAAIASLIAACSSTPVAPVQQTAVKSNAPAANAMPVAPVNAASASNPLKDPNNVLSKRSVYFDYDKYSVDERYRALVLAHATYLRSHPEVHIRLEGNADERGSAEYNLALGQKRAEVVRKMLHATGVADQQMEAISFGKEKPKALGSDEASWAENRRTDLRYRGE